MKKLSLLAALSVTILLGMSFMAMAAESMPPGKVMTMEGYIIDSKCAEANKANLADFVKTHTKECATADACKASGYNLYSDDKLYKFDKASNKKVSKFLAKADSTMHVNAKVKHEKDDMVKLISIENAK